MTDGAQTRNLRSHNPTQFRELHSELKVRGSETVPERPDELSKMVLAIAARGLWLGAKRGWGKRGGESSRMLYQRLRNGVDGVVGVAPPDY